MKDPSTPSPDPVLDVLRYKRQPLDPIFAPASVAVIGATEKAGSAGRTILANLIGSPFGGKVFPISPNRKSVLGVEALRHIADVPERVDLAVVVTPAPAVPTIVRDCANAGVRGAIIISAGFRETGSAGAELERQVLMEARRGSMRLIGPNCLGIMSPIRGLNAAFVNATARPGNVAFISQSGALCAAILDWSLRQNVGFSAFVSVGSMLDVDWGDLIDYLGSDPSTQSIMLYMESVGDARSFLSAAREVALTKPIIAIKAGRSRGGAKAVASHTGSLTGDDEALDAAFRRCGVRRVDTIAQLFYMADALGKQPRPRGPRLAIVTNAGGPGVLAADALIDSGGELAELAPETIDALGAILPAQWSRGNPIDMLGDAEPGCYAQAIEIAARDPSTDGLLAIVTPQAGTDAAATAERMRPFAKIRGKPILVSLMGGDQVAEAGAILNTIGIPSFAYPDTAARMFHLMWRYSYNLRGLYETPTLPVGSDSNAPDHDRAAAIVDAARSAGRTLLSEAESKELLAAYGIPTVETQVAASEAEAVKLAEAFGYPVVLKLLSHTITHKNQAGGVRLCLTDAAAVRQAYRKIESAVRQKASAADFLGVTVQPMIQLEGYELIVGSNADPQLGPVLLFGSGGQLVEILRDRALGLPPLNTTLARRLMERTRIFEALKGHNGRPRVDLDALDQLLVRFSQLVVEQEWIKEIEINPLLASAEQLIALDARIVLYDAAVTPESRPKLAIRPYPAQYVRPATTKDGTPITIRPIRPEDEPLMVKFHETLSERSVYLRYFHLIGLSQRVMHERLTRICFIDYDREMALVAEGKDAASGMAEILAVGRLSKLRGTDEAEFALLISDRFQNQGLGTELLRRLIEVGRDERVRRIVAEILPDNRGMRRICEKLGFRLRYAFDEGVVKAQLELG